MNNNLKNVIEEHCRCAGIFLIRTEKEPTDNGICEHSCVSDNADNDAFSNTLTPEQVKVLLVEGKRKCFQYSFPKGKRNKNEKTLDTAKRELYEETGIKEEDYTLISGRWYIEYRPEVPQPHIVYYLAILKNHDVSLCPIDTKEIKSAGWFAPSDIYSMRTSFYLQRRQIVTRAVRDFLRQSGTYMYRQPSRTHVPIYLHPNRRQITDEKITKENVLVRER